MITPYGLNTKNMHSTTLKELTQELKMNKF